MTIKHILIFLLFIPLFLMSCKTTSSKIINISDGEYLITKLKSEVIDNSELSITFNSEKNIISGYSGCNTYSGNYIRTDNNLTISKIRQTKKYCADKDINRREKIVIKILPMAKKIEEFQSNELLIKDDNDQLLMALKRIE